MYRKAMFRMVAGGIPWCVFLKENEIASYESLMLAIFLKWDD